MDELRFLSRALAGRGYAATRQIHRTAITAVEQETKVLPPEIVRPDGSLSLYDDVKSLFTPVFQNGQPAIQCRGWLGYIPLNDEFALEVNSRVPIRNLERLIGMANGYTPNVLKKYTRYFAHTGDTPAALFDILSEQLLASFDRAWNAGLLKAYERRECVGPSPVGRIDPIRTAWRTRTGGHPMAAFTAFFRTPDIGTNRVIRYAFEKLLQRYLQASETAGYKSRLFRIRRCLDRLSMVGRPSPRDVSPRAIAQYIDRLPPHHEHYADVLMLSQLVIADVGPSIRGAEHLAILPTILIDMSEVFETYVRRLLANEFSANATTEVCDGNKAGAGGAKKDLFQDIRPRVKNRPATPDIVITIDGVPDLIIDAKYKPSRDVPDRPDLNQIVLYGARYSCQRIMVLYAGRNEDQDWVEKVGEIGTYTIYTGQIDLGADQIEDEEHGFVDAVSALLAH